MQRWQRWIGPLLILMGLLHCVAADWGTLRRMVSRGWWLSADTAEASSAAWFLAAGFALVVLGLAVGALSKAGVRLPLSVGIVFLLLMVTIFTATGMLGALLGIVMGVVLILAAALPARREQRAATTLLDPDTV